MALISRVPVRDIIRSHRSLALVTCVALGVRVAFFLPVHSHGYTSDEREYISMAGQLAEGGEFVDSNGERSTRAPLFPFFLALLFRATGNSVITALLIDCVLGTFAVALGYFLCLRVWEDRQVALISAAVMAVYPGQVIYSGLLQTETLYCVFFLLALLFAYRAGSVPSPQNMIGLGLASGLAALTRVVFLGFFPVLLVMTWWQRKNAHRGTGLQILLAILVFCLVLAPWTIRNYRIYHALVPVSSGGGNSLLTGNNPYATGTWRVEQGFEQWYDTQARKLGISNIAQLNDVEKSSLSGRIAREYIVSHPREILSLVAKKAQIFFVYPITHSDSLIPLQAFAVACDFLLMVGAVFGYLCSFGARGRRGILYAALVFFSLIQIVLHAEARFRLPLVPLFSMFFGVGIVTVMDSERRERFFSVKKNTQMAVMLLLVVVLTYGVTGVLFLKGSL